MSTAMVLGEVGGSESGSANFMGIEGGRGSIELWRGLSRRGWREKCIGPELIAGESGAVDGWE